MKRLLLLIGFCGLSMAAIGSAAFAYVRAQDSSRKTVGAYRLPPDYERGFELQVIVNGRPLEEYAAQGKSYVEALAGAEYEVRIRNLQPYRVAVALSVDGLNTIDARHTSAWNASKWVIEPYGSISVGGWQMSSDRARRFYFTSERDSYGAKLGQTANLGVISAVFFRERRPRPVTVAPPPRPLYEEDGRSKRAEAPASGGTSEGADNKADSASTRKGQIAPQPDDEYAATGIGRSVQNDVRWVDMELDSRSVGELAVRYEYYSALVRLGILPRRYERPDPLRRREGARGFEDRRFSPEP